MQSIITLSQAMNSFNLKPGPLYVRDAGLDVKVKTENAHLGASYTSSVGAQL